RTYLNFLFTPTDDWTMRVTPDIYRTLGSANGDRVGRTTAFGSNLSGDLGFRLKYAYLDYNKPFAVNDSLKEDKLTFGMLPNPLIAWEEDLFGYRYVALVPWNYTSLSSSHVG